MCLRCRLSSLHSDWRPRFRRASFANPACRTDGWRCVWVPGCPGCHEVPSCPPHCAGWVRIKHTQSPNNTTALAPTTSHSHHWGAKQLMEKASLASLASHSQSASEDLRGPMTKSHQHHTTCLYCQLRVWYLIFRRNECSMSSVLLLFDTILRSRSRCSEGGQDNELISIIPNIQPKSTLLSLNTGEKYYQSSRGPNKSGASQQ